MDNSRKIISDLIIQLGTAIGFLQGLTWNPGIQDSVNRSVEDMIKILEKNADRIMKELDNESN